MLLAKVKSHFQPGGAARNVATLTMGTLIAQGITFAATPLLTRLYSPSDFGLLAIFLAVVSVGATLVTLRYEASILVPKENSESANLVFLSLILGCGLSLFLAVASALLTTGLQEKVGLGALGNWLSIAFLTAGCTSGITVVQGWMNREKKYKELMWLRVGQSFILVVLAVTLGMLNISNGLLITQFAASLCICIVAFWYGRSATHLWNSSQLLATALTHTKTPKYLLPTALLDVVTMQMPVVLIAMWFGKDEAGQFSMAWRLLMIPISLIGGAMGQVFLKRFSEVIDDIDFSIKIIKHSWTILFCVGIIPFGLIFVGGDYIFEKLLGDKWLIAGGVAMTLAPMAMAVFVSSPTSGSYVILGLQKYSLIFGFTTLLYRPICIYIGKLYNNLILGLWIWVVLEIITITAYQYLAIRKLNEKKMVSLS